MAKCSYRGSGVCHEVASPSTDPERGALCARHYAAMKSDRLLVVSSGLLMITVAITLIATVFGAFS